MTEPRKHRTILDSPELLKELEKVTVVDFRNNSKILKLVQEAKRQQEAILKLKDIDQESLNRVIDI